MYRRRPQSRNGSRFRTQLGIIILIASIVAVMLVAIIDTQAFFVGDHALQTDTSNDPEGSIKLCSKCHDGIVNTVKVSAHPNSGCLCHGYNPTITPSENVNVAHNMTKQIYCTNCHSNYDNVTGEITLSTSPFISGLNQSGHYITNDTATLYRHAQDFFNM